MRTVFNLVASMVAGLALTVAAVASSAPQEPAQRATSRSERELVGQMEEAIGAAGWDDDRWNVLVVSLDVGDTLYSHRADEAAIPASNLKLFTTAAGLYFLGSDYRYSTYLTGMGPVRNGVL